MKQDRSYLILFALFLFSFLLPSQAAETLTETDKIKALISHVEGLKDATFIRNGSNYSAKNAAKFLNGKWDANKKDIVTANDFIEKAASKSSTTGKPYMIKLKGAEEIPCADYLRAQLKKIESGS